MGLIDLTGKVYGKLTVVEFKGLAKNRSAKWLCRCECGKEKVIAGDALKRGATKSCGCVYYPKTKDLTGKVFGRLTVVSLSHIDTNQRLSMWLCQCECGNTRVVRGTSLTSKHTISCGCLKIETSRETKNFTGKKFGRLTVLREVKRKGKKHYLACKCDCGKIKVVDKDSLTQGTTKSCGCLFKEAMTGSNNPSWKGGITPENRKARTSGEYGQWRKSVFQRDNYTCQKCHQRGGVLHAHHIRSFATNPKLRTDLKNGITLCEHCHLSFHQHYGKTDNNKRQLNSFMKI